MRVLRIGLLAAAVLIFAVAALAQTTNQPVVDIRENDTVAEVNAFLPNDTGWVMVFVHVARTLDSTTGQKTTNLLYFTLRYVASPNPPYTTFVNTFGSGQIPNAALQGDSTAHLSLSLDTSQVAGVSVTTCTTTFGPFSYSCSPGSPGPMNFDWQAVPVQVQVTANTRTTYVDYTTVQHQNIDESQASATGSIMGLQLTNVSGLLGIDHDGEVLVYHNPPQQ